MNMIEELVSKIKFALLLGKVKRLNAIENLENLSDTEQDFIILTWLKEDCEAIAAELRNYQITDHLKFSKMIEQCDLLIMLSIASKEPSAVVNNLLAQTIAENYKQCMTCAETGF